MTALEILNIARAEIGYAEGANNDNKYGIAYGLNYQPWCVIFVWWCFRQAGDSGELFPDAAHCDGVRAFAHNKNAWVTSDYLPGDLVIFDWDGDSSGDHIGIVESINEDGTIVNIEGNCGDMVKRITRTTANVIGAYRPDYTANAEGDEESDGDTELPSSDSASDSGVVDDPTVEYPLMVNGYKGVFASLLQAKLTIYGYSCGGVDGEVGAKTMAAVKNYQAANGLEADGICGPLTWTSLWKGGY